MNYTIEADWHMLDTCNYRCGYCFFGPETLGAKLRTFSDPRGWSSAFDATGAIWLLHMTGGEPSIYPDFVELCERLTARHFISINSNLSHASLGDFSRRIDPSRVSFINAGLHLEERELRNGHDIHRCGGGDPQGNVLARTFVRREGPALCDTQHCYYFCNKYSDASPLRGAGSGYPHLAVK